MSLNFRSFIFESYHFAPEIKKLTLKYSFDSDIFFEEEFVFNFEFAPDYSEEALNNAFFGLFVMAGISYFKAALPPEMEFKTGGLNPKQKDFFEKVYLHGLGEFFFQNDINPTDKINFVSEITNSKHQISNNSEIKNSAFRVPHSEIVVPIGGGKDSITTAEILKSKNIKFETWSVGNNNLINNCCKKIGVPHLKVHRKIAPELLELNKKGALNGHVPISAILAFLSVITAILRGRKNIAFSNESSANQGNTEFRGVKINHQYSKTLEFEKDFQNYVQKFIAPDIHYFSFLRPLTELKIAQIFCQNFLEKYRDNFSSCNRNFHISNSKSQITNYICNLKSAMKKQFWCGKCPKCAFVFVIFSPFCDRKKLIDLFGKNLFIDSELAETFDELLGNKGIKPFECVGEIEEVQTALVMAKNSGNWPELEKFKIPETNFDLNTWNKHAMPTEFEKVISFVRSMK